MRPGKKSKEQEAVYSAKELSAETWADFVQVFSQGSGWDHCQCMHFHRPHALPKSLRLRKRAERALRNRKQKKELVERGFAHGIIVYAKGEPVGWCQFGLREELPRIDNVRKYREGGRRLNQRHGHGRRGNQIQVPARCSWPGAAENREDVQMHPPRTVVTRRAIPRQKSLLARRCGRH